MADDLAAYRRKRDARRTPEPAGTKKGRRGKGAPRFVVQEHDATRLHWDLRLEHDGVAASWAVPNGIPRNPKDNRLAVHTEDHPLEYLEWEGDIPAGQYGAGRMRIWDRGTYELHKWEPKKVEVTFHGERVQGRYGLFPIGPDPKDWMIHRMDPPADPDWEPLPERVPPMLARIGDAIPSGDDWVHEVKWDGIRAVLYAVPGTLRVESRTGRDITAGYPELRKLHRALGAHEVVLDGEIVAFAPDGRPSFERLQRRMHVTSESAVRRLAQDVPVVYAVFDLLHLDGRSLMRKPWSERRAALEELDLNGPSWRTPGVHDDGVALLAATREQGLEGVVSKRRSCPYEPGRRPGTWVKVKNRHREPFVIGGWLPGEGKREGSIGALLVGERDESGALQYCGRVGTGFTEKTLRELGARLAPLRQDANPFAGRRGPRGGVWVEPCLEAEVEYVERTREGILRAPSYKGLCDREDGELFDSVRLLKDGGREVVIEGRTIKVSNWDKVLFPRAGFTKGDLVEYYVRIAPVLLPHLRDRALTLKRYPNGVEGQYFYEKQCPSHAPPWIAKARGPGGADYCLAQEVATLVWLGNLADLELHTSLSHVAEQARPSMMVFDLDPGEPAGILECCEVGLVLRGLFDALQLRSFAKTSGSKGLQIYVPLNVPRVTYDDTKPFSKAIAELLERRLPELVVSRQTKSIRGGKILVDWSQNDEHKTTVNVYSVRAKDRPTVSTPVSWDEVEAARASGDPERLVFTVDDVLARVEDQGDLFAPVLSCVQELPKL